MKHVNSSFNANKKLDIHSKEADKVANLYRTTFYIAKGANDLGIELIKKTGESFPDLTLNDEKSRMYWAEKVLDRSILLKQKMTYA